MYNRKLDVLIGRQLEKALGHASPLPYIKGSLSKFLLSRIVCGSPIDSNVLSDY
ncbi:unnamed protein product [Candida parapsilosis]